MKKFIRTFFYLLFRVFTRLTVVGLDNIPFTGGCLVTANHIGILDGPLVFCLIKRDDVTGLAALKHKNNPIIRFIVDGVGGIWINRTETDFKALKKARSHLKNGGLLGITPEGTRSNTQALIEAKPGVAFLADKSDSVVVPTAIVGTEKSLIKLFTLQRPKISVEFGKPFQLPPVDRNDKDGALQRNTDEIMYQIAALLPEKYRGVYSQYPR